MAKTAVSQKTAGKIGLIGSISLIISTVVGVGVFFKNGSVFKNNDDWALGIMLSWGLAIVIALFTAFSFAEIVTVKGMRNPNAGLAGWSEKMIGYNFGRHVSITQSTFYYAAKFVAMGTYAAVSIFIVYFAAVSPLGEAVKFRASMLGVDDKYTTLITMSLAVVLIAIFLTANFFSSKFGQVVSKGATIIKFIPILMIAFIGIIVGALMGGGLWKNATLETTTVDTAITLVSTSNATAAERVNGIFRSIPAILFAFDSFLVIGNVSKNVENPEKNVPLAIIISMIVAAIFQILITIGCITTGTGNPFNLLKWTIWQHCGSKVGYIITVTILSVSLVTATLGVLSSYSVAGTTATQALVDEETIIGYKWAKPLSQKHNNKLGGLLIYVIFIAFIFLAVAIPSCILNTSQIYDGFSTLVVLFYFAIYGTTILGGLINRKTGKNEVKKVGYFVPFGIIGVIGCYFAFAYTAFYQFGVQVIMDPLNDTANSFGFGMVYDSGNPSVGFSGTFNNWQAATVFWSAAVFFLGFPFLNDALIKATDKNYAHPFIWTVNKKKTTTVVSK